MITSESCVRRKLFTGFEHSWFGLSYLVLPILPAHDHDCLCAPSIVCVLPRWLNGCNHLKMPHVCPATVLLFITDLTGSDGWQCNWVKREMLCPAGQHGMQLLLLPTSQSTSFTLSETKLHIIQEINTTFFFIRVRPVCSAASWCKKSLFNLSRRCEQTTLTWTKVLSYYF